MDETEQTDWLDRRLREAAPYIDDAGFTRSVLQKLPARRQPESLRAAILIGMALLASVLAFILAGRIEFVTRFVLFVASIPPLQLLIAAAASGILVTAIGLAAAISKTRELQT